MTLLSPLLVISILAGQLIKIPLVNSLGPTLLDFYITLTCLVGLISLKFKLKKPPLFIIFGLLFILTGTLSLVLTPLQLKSSEYILSFSYIIRFSQILLFSWLIFSKAFEKFKVQIYSTLVMSGIGLAVLGLLQLIVIPDLQFLSRYGWDPHYFRTVSTFLDPNFVGAYFVLTLILLFHKFPIQKKWLMLATSVVSLALLTTFSRSSYLMFLISGLTFSFLEKSLKLIIVTILLFIFLIIGFQIYAQQVTKPRNIDRAQSASFRFSSWQQGLTIFQISPILGVGFNSYRYAIRDYNLADLSFLESHGSTSNDSSLLSVLATTGVIGLFFYLLFFIALIKESLIRKNFALTAGLAGLIIHSFFANSLFFPAIFIWIMIKAPDIKG